MGVFDVAVLGAIAYGFHGSTGGLELSCIGERVVMALDEAYVRRDPRGFYDRAEDVTWEDSGSHDLLTFPWFSRLNFCGAPEQQQHSVLMSDVALDQRARHC